MRRQRQTFQKIVARLSSIEIDWKDDLSEEVINILKSMPRKHSYTYSDVTEILSSNFKPGITVVRLFLDLSKDEFKRQLRDALEGASIGITTFKNDPGAYVKALEKLSLLTHMNAAVRKPVDWKDVLIERLKSGRGSAIKGQKRGKKLEDFTERSVKRIFGPQNYDVRCRFVGESGGSTEKADFAIPSKEDPRILIEVKAYGATGSKLTDVLGDITRIVNEKRHDTDLLLVTDGKTWEQRANDLKKLIEMQNRGRIARIYTMAMKDELIEDLKDLKREHGL